MNSLKKIAKFNKAANTWLADLENKSAEEIFNWVKKKNYSIDFLNLQHLL